jgi:hypothetical protein
MSCWVVPTVAAEYWGISLDVVLRRITDGLVPHMSESGFVFVDVDPWATACTGAFRHAAPPTFVSTADILPTVESSSGDLLLAEDDSEEDFESESLAESSEEPHEMDQHAGDLPELDEEESATFGRLSWEEVRQQVSRTRRAPSYRN